MYKSKLLTHKQQLNICEIHKKDKLNPRELGEMFNVNGNTIIRVLKHYNCYTPSKKYTAHNKHIVWEYADNIVEMYEGGKSAVEIARIYNCSHKTILEILYNADVEIRDASNNRRKLSLNDDCFDIIDTEEKAYWLGFLYADGSVCGNDISLTLHSQDSEHIEKFKQFTNYGGITRVYSNKGLDTLYCRVTIVNKHLSETLKAQGCVERKSLILKYPKGLAKELHRHFIRGYFDGDGCIGYSKVRDRYVINLLGTKEFLEEVNNIFKDNLGIVIKSPKIAKKPNKNVYQFCYGAYMDIEKILKFLYEDSNIYLERKYKRYKDFINKLHDIV